MSEYILAALLVISNGFWAYVSFRLINRLMSRNFFEFRQAEAKPAKREVVKLAEEPDEYAEQQAAQINSIMQLG